MIVRIILGLAIALLVGAWRLDAAAASTAPAPRSQPAVKTIASPIILRPVVKARPLPARQHKKKSHKGG